MEQISDEQKAKHAAAERTESPAVSTRKMINTLILMGDRIKARTVLTGEEVRSLVDQIEGKGFQVPETSWDKLDMAEKRSLQSSFDTKIAGISLSFKTRAAIPVSRYTDAELTAKWLRQERQFAEMLAAEEKPDPLLNLAKSRARVPVMKGKLSKEDQALYDQHKSLTGR